MAVNEIAGGYFELASNNAAISNELTILGRVDLPANTTISGDVLQTLLDSKATVVDPVLDGSITFENLEIDNVPLNTLIIAASTSSTTTITFGDAFVVSGDIYTLQIPFSSAIALPYTANIVVHEISGTAMTVVITEYNTNYVRFRIMMPTFQYIVMNTFNSYLNMNCSIMKGGTVFGCANVAFGAVSVTGLLDNISIYSTAVTAYAVNRLFVQYTGASIQVRRSSDNLIFDVWFDKNYTPIKVKSTATGSTDIFFDPIYTFSRWIGSNVLYLRIWYDQSTSPQNLTQTTAESQPIFQYDSVLNSYAVRFSAAQLMQAANPFALASITNMQFIARTREVERTSNFGLNYNGTNTGSPGRFSLHLPWSDGTWYWDPNDASTNRCLIVNPVAVGAIANVSGYKSSSENRNGLFVNASTATSSGFSTASVDNGVALGSGYNGFFKYLITLNTKTTDTIRDQVFAALA
jgi:hypothetical protein